MAETDRWVVLELGPKAEGEDPDHIRASIRHSIRDAEVFIPASVTKMGEDKVIQYLMEGYAFVKRTHPDHTYLRLENTKYVQAVLREPSAIGGRNVKKIADVSDREIEKFRSQIRVEVDQGISVGDLVMITSGAYRQINAIVEEEIPELDQVQVHVQLRSKQAIVTLPRACLRLVRKAQKSVHRARLDAVQAWLRSAWAILGWPRDEFTRVLLPYDTYIRLGDWLLLRQRLVRTITTFDAPLDFGPVQERYKAYERLSRLKRLPDLLRSVRASQGVLVPEVPQDFGPVQERYKAYEHSSRLAGLPELIRSVRTMQTAVARPISIPPIEPLMALAQRQEALSRWVGGKKLYGWVSAVYNHPPSPKLFSRYLDWAWLNDINERLDAVRSSIGEIEHAIQTGDQVGMFQNLIVDGTQLALRCLLVPGLDSLKDSKGRPTGAILGFCQSLASLKKRYPTTTFFVTWDGSSQRRKKLFAGYKASRASRSPMATFEIQFLKSLLPKLGVWQAYNPEEEADDVIATLVRDRLKGQLNCILTTDRDMLQLVTETDHQLVPAVGSGKEKLYTVESVTNEYGVGPDQITQVRALVGDTSDEIPGADGFGLKTASKVVKLYGSLERLFASNFAGLTPKQFSALRAAEKQVILNLELMKLQADLALTIVGPDPDQIAATERLREVDIKPDPLLAFFNNAPGLSAQA